MLKSLAIREMEIKAKMGEHVTPVSITIIKEANYNECGQDCGEIGTLLLHLWEYKVMQPFRRTVGSSSQK